jgi:hypothetical protein
MGREDSFRALFHNILLLMNLFLALTAPAGGKLKPLCQATFETFPKQSPIGRLPSNLSRAPQKS